MKKRVFAVRIEIRNENGKIVEDARGCKITELKCDLEVDDNENTYKQLELKMRELHDGLKAFLPKHQINLNAMVRNLIDGEENFDRMGTWTTMAGFYGEENRFVKFS